MKMTWKWAACGYSFSVYQSNEDIIELCKQAKIPAIEMNSGFTNNKSDKEIEGIREIYNDARIELYSFHLPFSNDDDIASFYETKRREAVEKLTRIMEQASLLGNKVVILHPTAFLSPIEVEGFDRYLSQMEKSLEKLIPAAERLNLVIALENMPPGIFGDHFASRPEHFTLFKERFACPNLGFCLDTGHAHISLKADGPSIFFDAMKENIVAFHIQDNPGDRDLHLAPGYGLIDWERVFKKMAEIEFSHPACIEAPPFGYTNNCKYSADLWKTMLEDVDSLATKILT